MPVTPAAGDIIEVSFLTHMRDQLGVNVRHYAVTNTVNGGATMAEILNSLSNQTENLYADLMTSDATFRGMNGRIIFPGLSPTVEHRPTPTSGTYGPDGLPTQCTGIITLRTAESGRSKRGRVYVPFPDESACDPDGLPTNAYVTALNTLGNKLIEDQSILGGGGEQTDLIPVIWSRKFVWWTEVESFYSRQKFATQRSRGSYGSVNPKP